MLGTQVVFWLLYGVSPVILDYDARRVVFAWRRGDFPRNEQKGYRPGTHAPVQIYTVNVDGEPKNIFIRMAVPSKSRPRQAVDGKLDQGISVDTWCES